MKKLYTIQSKSKYIYYTGLYFIAAILIFSGSTKIIDPEPLNYILNLLEVLPEPMVIFISVILPVTEIMLGIFLFFNLKAKVTLSFTSVLFLSFLLFAIYGTLTGISSECGCFGNILKSNIGWGMIVRNIVLFIIVVLLYFNSAESDV